MPRVEFNSVASAEDFIATWVKGVRKGNYTLFATAGLELIMVPATSTDPVIYGYVRLMTADQLRILSATHNLPVVHCDGWVWDSEHTPKES